MQLCLLHTTFVDYQLYNYIVVTFLRVNETIHLTLKLQGCGFGVDAGCRTVTAEPQAHVQTLVSGEVQAAKTLLWRTLLCF